MSENQELRRAMWKDYTSGMCCLQVCCNVCGGHEADICECRYAEFKPTEEEMLLYRKNRELEKRIQDVYSDAGKFIAAGVVIGLVGLSCMYFLARKK